MLVRVMLPQGAVLGQSQPTAEEAPFGDHTGKSLWRLPQPHEFGAAILDTLPGWDCSSTNPHRTFQVVLLEGRGRISCGPVSKLECMACFSWFRNTMSRQEEDARDLEMQREVEEAFEYFLNADSANRLDARLRYLEILKEFTARVLNDRLRVISC
jgi:hypothetical protein